jgi:nucleoside-diphosphate-sugar epimerase
VTPDTIASPEGSYGCGKLISELLVNEYSRRGFVDGRVIRLPTIVVRPGQSIYPSTIDTKFDSLIRNVPGLPSPATSAFVSGIIREPLHGEEAICPIGDSFDDPSLDELEVWVASPENVIENFVIASQVDASKFRSHSRVVNLPGFTVTIKQELEALRDVAGQE